MGEITSPIRIENGLQLFARAWDKNGEQIGFGTDGTVDLERFRFFNPRIIVPDPQGDIVRTWGLRMENTKNAGFGVSHAP